MKILFVHQNFPGQFKFIYQVLATDPANHIMVFTMKNFDASASKGNVQVVAYQPGRSNSPDTHPWLTDIETKTIRAEAAFNAAMQIKAEGFTPDLIIGHPAWGECLCLKEVWPTAKTLLYAEFYYQAAGRDVGFDPEFGQPTEYAGCRTRFKNINNLLNLEIADVCISPTNWQKSTFPTVYQTKIRVIHDGIDTDAVKPNLTAKLQIGDRFFTKSDEIITFVNRNLEPYRGYHIFMRALPKIMANRPNATVVIVGGSGVSYGASAPEGQTWKEIYLSEVRDQLDMNRIHFVGQISYPTYLGLLSCSTVHVYLTYPFVLSWSLLEAMACECAIVASNTEPVREAIIDGQTGKLVDFFNHSELADSVISLLQNPAERSKLGVAARQHVINHYDLKRVSLPRLLQLINEMGTANVIG